MKNRFAIGLAALALSAAACATEPVSPCARVKTARDAFDGEQRRFTMALDWTSAITVVGSQSTRTLSIVVHSGGMRSEVARRGDPLTLALGERQVALRLKSDALPVRDVGANQVSTTWQLVYDLSPADAALLARLPIVAWRTSIGAVSVTRDVKPERAAVIRNSIGCVVNGPPREIAARD